MEKFGIGLRLQLFTMSQPQKHFLFPQSPLGTFFVKVHENKRTVLENMGILTFFSLASFTLFVTTLYGWLIHPLNHFLISFYV